MAIEAAEAINNNPALKTVLYTGDAKSVIVVSKQGNRLHQDVDQLTPYIQIEKVSGDTQLTRTSVGLGKETEEGFYRPALLRAHSSDIQQALSLADRAENYHYSAGIDPALEYLAISLLGQELNPSRFWGHDLARVRSLLLTNALDIKTVPRKGGDYYFVRCDKRLHPTGKHQNLKLESEYNPADEPVMLARFLGFFREGTESLAIDSSKLDQMVLALKKGNFDFSISGLAYLIKLGVYLPEHKVEEIIAQKRRDALLKKPKAYWQSSLQTLCKIRDNVNKTRSWIMGEEAEDPDELSDHEDIIVDRPNDELSS